MTDHERAVLEAAFDLALAQSGHDCGVLTKGNVDAFYRKLLDACSDLASENDGRLIVRED